MDLVALIKDQFGGDTIAKLAGACGIDVNSARTAMDAGVPAMLAGLTKVASTDDGARRLAMAVDGTDDRTAMNFGQIVSSGSRGLVESGGSMLNSLFGSGTASSLSGVISKFTGVGSNATGSLLAMITPMVMGVLKGRKQEEHLDAGGLSNMLQDQKGNIARAMPAGLGSMLASAMPNFAGLAGSAKAAVGSAADTTRRTAHAAKTSGSRWVVPLLIALAVGALLWWMLGRGRNVAPTIPATAPSVPAAVPQESGAALRSEVTKLFQSTTDTLAGVKDAATAQVALPRLEEMSARMDTVKQSVAGLPESARSSIAGVARDGTAGLTNQLDRVKALPGLSDEVKRVVGDISVKANALGV